ncbi:MAG: hypothetical protein MUF38_08325 [Anaerolineae bacterium]|nr:hypothetical protein [Anaerolineae bacterium]
MDEKSLDAWVERVRARGWAGMVSAALGMVGPLAPLAAQLLHVGQPVARVLASGFPLGALADALEEPGGVEALRKRLEDGPPAGA